MSVYAVLLSRKTFGKDKLRPFAQEIVRHTGSPSRIILFRTPERMWPFYLGQDCREIAELDELPAQARWVMILAKDRDANLPLLEHRYGKAAGETRLKEPLTSDAGGKGWEFVLLEFTP